MSHPTLSLGTWDEFFLQWLSDPSNRIGGGYLHKVKTDPETMMLRHPPYPLPWVVNALVSAAGVLQLAKSMPEGAAQSQLQGSANASIAQVLDDYCGTPPRLVPWPWPGPPPWVFAIASQLTAIADTMHGGIREELLGIAGQLASQAVANSPFDAEKKLKGKGGPPPAPQPPPGGNPVLPDEGGPSTPDPPED